MDPNPAVSSIGRQAALAFPHLAQRGIMLHAGVFPDSAPSSLSSAVSSAVYPVLAVLCALRASVAFLLVEVIYK